MTLAIYCAGGLGKEVIALARSVCRWEHIVFVDDVTEVQWCHGAKVVRFWEVERFCSEMGTDIEFVIASGEPAVRERLYEKIKSQGYKMATIFGPGCAVLPGAAVQEGCILYDCAVSVDALVKHNVLINTKVILGHDAVIGAHSVLSAFSFIGGNTHVGERTYFAPGAMAKDHIRVGHDSIVSLGAVLLRDTRPRAIMIGNPARRLGENASGRVFSGETVSAPKNNDGSIGR